MSFGQLVIGSPGSGKTTYCNGMQQYLQLTGRQVAVVNLDPANDNIPYDCAIDIADLVSLDEVMETLHLGPNGGLLYCMEYLEQNQDWLQERLQPLQKEGYYFLFDCPGQVELFTLHNSLQNILHALTDRLHIRLAAVELIDAHLCTDAGKYLSALLLSLSSMLHLELPHVNVLSKADLMDSLGDPDFDLDFYAQVQDLSHLVEAMAEDPFGRKYTQLSSALAEVIQDYGLVSYVPLAIEDKDSVQQLVALVDKATGFVFTGGTARKSPYPAEYVYGEALTESSAVQSQEQGLAQPELTILERPIAAKDDRP